MSVEKTKKRFTCLAVVLFFIFGMPAVAFADTGTSSTTYTYSDGEWCQAIVQTKSIYQFDDKIFASGDAEKIMAEVQKQDRYADYYTPEQYAATMLDLEGKKVAAGIQTAEIDGKVEIVGLIDGSPASLSGVKVGDIITHVDGESITGLAYKDAIMKMQGAENTFLKIHVLRDGKSLDFEIIRLQIYIPSIEKKMLDDTTGYIRILEFDEGTDTMVADAVKSLQEQGMQGLVLDLRGCPGGLLTSTAGTADQFIPAGPIIFVESGNGSQYYYRATEDPLGIPLVVLVDGSTASGAEVLAGDIKDSGTGLLVGETTYGKGTVQNFYVLPSGSAIKLTIARYYTRNYYDVAGHKGINPDVYLEGDWYGQLDRAVELLHERLPYGEGVTMQVGVKSLTVGKKTIELSVAPFVSKGSVYVPLRQTAEAMGVFVDWQGDQVTLSTAQKTFVLNLAGKTLEKSGFKLSTSLIDKNGSYFLPARFLAEVFDWDLEWNENAKSISINF